MIQRKYKQHRAGYTPEERHRPPVEESISEKISEKLKDIKEKLAGEQTPSSPEPEIPQPDPEQEKQYKARVYKEKIPEETAERTRKKELDLARKIAGESEEEIGENPTPDFTREERRQRREKRKQSAPRSGGEQTEKRFAGWKKEIVAGAKQAWEEVKPAVIRAERGVHEVAGDYKVKQLRGTSDGEYRVDPDNGDLYRKDKNGNWYNTHQKTRYPIPSTVVDSRTGFKTKVYSEEDVTSHSKGVTEFLGGHSLTEEERRRKRHGFSDIFPYRDTKEKSPFAGNLFGSTSGLYEPSDDLYGRSSFGRSRYGGFSSDRSDRSIFSGSLFGSSSRSRYGSFRDNEGSIFEGSLFGSSGRSRGGIRDRFEEPRETPSLKVSNSFLGATKMTGWNEQRERERLETFKQKGSPIGAGINYLGAGATTMGAKQGLGGRSGSGLLNTMSTGNFSARYGNARPQQVSQPPSPISESLNEPSRMTRAERSAENKRLHAMQRQSASESISMGEPVSVDTMQQLPQQPSARAGEAGSAATRLFGSGKNRGYRGGDSTKSAVNSFFGMTTKPRIPLQQSSPSMTDSRPDGMNLQPQASGKKKSATELLFGRK